MPASPSGDDAFVCRSEGSTKKAAEQAAARLAWEHLQSLKSRSAAERPAAGRYVFRAVMSEAGAQTEVTAALPHRSRRFPSARHPEHCAGLHSLQSLASTIVIAVFVITFIVQAFQIPSESMEKTC